MLDIQLGRCTLSPIQRIAVTEKYRPIYEKQAAINKSLNGGDKKSESQNSSTPISQDDKNQKTIKNQLRRILHKRFLMKKNETQQ